MAAGDFPLLSLNSGAVSRFAEARVDLAKLKAACRVQSNFLPHVLGPCFMRPGTAFQDHTHGDSTSVRLLEFYFDATTKALLVLTPLIMRIMVNGAYITRVSVSTAITNGSFSGSLTGWTQSDEAGAVSAWHASNLMELHGTGTNYAFRDQQVTVSGPDPNKDHAIRLTVNHGPVRIQVGTSQGDNSYIDRTLLQGVYSLTFNPTTTFWIRLGSNAAYLTYITSIAIEASGIVEIPTPWNTSDLGNVFYDQSGDVLFCASGIGIQQQEIQRLGLTRSDTRSWGIAYYYVDDGPFLPVNTTDVTLIPSALSGNITLTASRNLFSTGHIGGIFRLVTSGQNQSATLSGAGQVTGNIRVTGIGSTTAAPSQRIFTITITGTFVGTIGLQRSVGAPGSWVDVETWTAPVTTTLDDQLNNQIIYYQLKMEAFTSGSAVATLNYAGSVQTGIVRVNGYNSALQVNADVLSQLSSTTGTTDWQEGSWSIFRGFPTAVGLHDGRLFWGGGGVQLWGSVSDAFASFDDTVTGDSAPISRSVATGGLDGMRWLLSLQRLIGGTAAQEISIRSSAFDEPLTPTAFVARICSTRGAVHIRPIRVDSFGIFIERNGERVFELAFDLQKGDYASRELTRLYQEIGAVGIVDVAVQRQPDTRIWFALADGTAFVLTYEREDDVVALTTCSLAAGGLIKAVAVLPGTDEDEVYFAVQRGSSCFVEKLAKRSEAGIAAVSKCMDCHVFAAGPTASVGFSHMPDGTSVVAWANGVPLPGPFTVSGGNVALGGTFSNITVGLAYTAQIETAKLAFGAERGTPLEQQKRIARLGLVMADVVPVGVKIGRDFSNLHGLPGTYRGKALTTGQALAAYDARPGSFPGAWDSDSRACIQVSSPYPATIMGLVCDMATNEPNAPEPPPRGSNNG